MKREPIALYVFRFLVGFAILIFMVMLYWSSVLIEKDLKWIQGDLTQMKGEISVLKRQLEMEARDAPRISPSSNLFNARKSDEAHNLLTPDPFYEGTLSKLLPPNFVPHGVRREAIIAKPNTLDPFSQWAEVAAWNRQCVVSLASQEVGKYETFTPAFAHSMELKKNEEGIPEYWCFLRQDIFWAPLNPHHFSNAVNLAPSFLKNHQVTAHDVKFYFDVVMNPHVEQELAVTLRKDYEDIEEIRVVDDFTLVVRWKMHEVINENGETSLKMKYQAKAMTGSLRPLPRFVYQYFADGTKIVEEDSDPDTYRTNPIWAQNFAHHFTNNIIVSCGPWLFDGMTDREIRFKRNADYYDQQAVLVERHEVQFRDSFDSIWNDFKSGSLDLYILPANLLPEYDQFTASSPYQQQKKNGLGVNRLDYLGRAYTYVGWNEVNPLFQSKKVRQALTMLIDRERIIRQNLNGMGMQITGTFSPLSPSYDKTILPYPFDPRLAKQLLQEEGWIDHDGDGILDKLIEGKFVPFRFNLTYYVKNSTSKSICEYIATALKNGGIDCKLNGVDLADISAIFENRNFDALYMAWSLGTPPEDPKQLWYSSGANPKGSSNFVSFSNAQADKIIDDLQYEDDPNKRIALYHRFDAILHEEAPYTFLYNPKYVFIYRDYLQNVFIPADRQDLIPGANMGEPESSIFWIKR